MKSRFVILFALVFTCFPALAQEGTGAQMDQTIAMLKSSGAGEPQSLTHMLNAASTYYLQEGDTEKAMERIKESVRLCRENDLDPTMTMITASRVLTKVDDDLASDFLLGELKAEGGSIQYKKGILSALDMHLMINGNQNLLIQVRFEALELVRAENPNSHEEAAALFQFGSAALTAQLFDVAIPTLEEATKMAVALGDPPAGAMDVATLAPSTLSLAYASAGNYEKALELQQRALDLVSSDDPANLREYGLRVLATTQLQMNLLDEAEKSIAELEGFAQDEFNRAFYLSLATALELRKQLDAGGKPDLTKTIALQKEVVAAKLTNTGGGMGKEFAYLGAYQDILSLASFQILTGQLDEADETLTDAERGAAAWTASMNTPEMAAIYTPDQANLASSQISAEVYRFRQQLEVARKDYKAALVYAENGRGSAQAAVLKSRLKLSTPDDMQKTLDYDQIAAIASEQNTTLVVYSLAYPISGDLQRYFAKGDPLRNPNALYIWTVSPRGEFTYESVPLTGSLLDLVDLARDEIQNPSENAPDESAMRVLSTLLIDPIEAALPKEDGSLVTFVPQDQLFLVPFAALPRKDGSTLIDRHTIGMTPSIELLDLARKQKAAVEAAGLDEVLLVGNPTMPGYQSRPDRDASALSPLPGAEAEAKYLASILGVEPLIGDAATETAIAARMENARILHFATHGILESENNYTDSFLSSLAFTADENEDGFLTVKETARMNLRAELAVLSACDTGRGQITGDGVIGLSRGYITAGVPTVVVSLWPVNDQATAILMGTYYEAMKKGIGKGAALREAILETKAKYPQPSLWAPFVLYGLAE